MLGGTYGIQSDSNRTSGLSFRYVSTPMRLESESVLTGDHLSGVVDDTLVIVIRTMGEVHAN